MSLNYNKVGVFIILYIICLCSCLSEQSEIDCDRQHVIQKCLNILSANERQYKQITLISTEIVNQNISLQWLKSPVKFEKNDLSDIRKLAESGKLYFMVTKFVCLKNKTEASIICINANLQYDFEIHRGADGKEIVAIVQEIDDALPFR
ncbi:hypothetical protein [Pedobacter yonginense]|nr:hypothetical protein [Pedobacter yonginense]